VDPVVVVVMVIFDFCRLKIGGRFRWYGKTVNVAGLDIHD
jgi:hypothetical protein